MSIEIATRNLIIRSFVKENITKEYLSWLNDKELMKYSEQRHKSHSFESACVYLESFKGSSNYFFAICSRSHNLIGTITVYQDINNKIFDMGILIGSEESRGKGYGNEAWSAVMSWIEDTFEVRKITAGAIENNKAMIGIMKKSGMTEDGIRRKHYLYKQKSVDVVYRAKSYKKS